MADTYPQMQPEDDSALLRQFAESQSDAAFAGLVARHVNLVHSVALRQVGNAHHAEEITQAVFLILARKARQLRHERALSSWLFQTTRLTANNFLRSELRRQRREQEAYMQSTLNEPAGDVWPQIAPLLDGAVESLGEKDRRAIVLRFYEGRKINEVGTALGASEAAAEKRVNRALEKLRKIFSKRGVTLSVGLIAGAVSANSVQAAPVGLATTVTATVAKGSAVAASTLALVKGVMNWMTWLQLKLAAVVGVAVVLTATTATVVIGRDHASAESLDAKIERLSRPGTKVAEAISLLGEPVRYANGTNTFSKGKLPESYSLVYTNGVEVWALRGRVMQLRSLRPGPGFGYHGKLRLGSMLEEVLDVVGPPLETIPGRPAKVILGRKLTGDPGVLYTEIGGEAGLCYYWRPDQNVEFLFKQNKVIALIIDVAN
jgi:RNA polymerase sigma factor (sigma-70 family)